MMKLQKLCMLGIVISCVILPTFSYGQNKNQSDESSVSQVLLNEIRLLRQTLQSMNLYAYRGQIIIERIRAQQDRITRLTSALESLQDEIRNLEMQGSRLDDHLKELNERIDRESESKQKAELENEAKAVKQALSQGKQREDELRKRESQLTTALGTEQSKLDELERKLEVLEIELEGNIESQRISDKKSERKLP